MNLKAFLFDFDETVVYSNMDHVRSYVVAAREYGLKNPDGKIHAMIGRSAINILAGLFPDMSLEELVRLRDEKERQYRKIIEHKKIRMVAGVRELLEFLRENKVKTGVVSSASLTNIRIGMRRNHLSKYFHEVVAAETVKRHKPNPDPVLRATRDLRVRPRDCILIGDSIYDVIAARKAGATAFGLSTGYYNARQLRKVGAKHVFKNHIEVLKFLKAKKGVTISF